MKSASFGWPLGMFGAHMGLEFLVALPFIDSFHFINGSAGKGC